MSMQCDCKWVGLAHTSVDRCMVHQIHQILSWCWDIGVLEVVCCLCNSVVLLNCELLTIKNIWETSAGETQTHMAQTQNASESLVQEWCSGLLELRLLCKNHNPGITSSNPAIKH
jgi:hypothetical protein